MFVYIELVPSAFIASYYLVRGYGRDSEGTVSNACVKAAVFIL